jgi:hypothetical protein
MAYEDPRRPGDPTPVRRGGWGAGWWIAFFVVVAFIIWAVAWSWNGRATRAGVTPAAPVRATTPAGGQVAAAPQVTVDQLKESSQNGQWVNRDVRLNDVQMVASAGNQAFWVSGSNGDRLLVVQNQNGNAMPQSDQPNNNGPAAANQQFQQGERLNISGTVQQVNSPTELQQQYGIQKEAASQLQQGQVYLLARQIAPQNTNKNQNQ